MIICLSALHTDRKAGRNSPLSSLVFLLSLFSPTPFLFEQHDDAPLRCSYFNNRIWENQADPCFGPLRSPLRPRGKPWPPLRPLINIVALPPSHTPCVETARPGNNPLVLAELR